MIRLIEITNETKKAVGGKAANLGQLYQNRFNVPNGFVVPVDDYYHFLEHNGLADKVAAKLQKLDTTDIDALQHTYKEIQRLFESASLPPGKEEQMHGFLQELEPVNGAVAVRSSATCEDLKNASFAGQYDTYLNIPPNKVSHYIKCCFASLFTPRAIVYREIKKFSHDVAMAVIIQEMVPAEFAGVLFTLDPQRKQNILIELASGPGENVVSGNVNPNNYFVNRETLAVEKCREVEEFDHPTVKQIAEIGLEIERHFSYPQDIEFALANNEIFILQARPITNL
ncbi:MAG: PEP/pyruvate-binding domain-containing protein [Candidatus Aminicenantes bacterium]|jgi:pyruvate,water dikinase